MLLGVCPQPPLAWPGQGRAAAGAWCCSALPCLEVWRSWPVPPAAACPSACPSASLPPAAGTRPSCPVRPTASGSLMCGSAGRLARWAGALVPLWGCWLSACTCAGLCGRPLPDGPDLGSTLGPWLCLRPRVLPGACISTRFILPAGRTEPGMLARLGGRSPCQTCTRRVAPCWSAHVATGVPRGRGDRNPSHVC